MPHGSPYVFALLLTLAPFLAVHASEGAGFSSRLSLDWLSFSEARYPRTGAQEAEAALLVPPVLTLGSELRPDLQLSFGEAVELVVRPRFILQASLERGGGSRAWQAEADVALPTLYAQYRVTSNLAVAYGLQNFQWGPADLLNASNRLFHVNALQRNGLFVLQGKELLRVNASWGQNLSAVLLVELRDNGEAPFVAGVPFDRKGLLKLEYSASDGASYVGLVGGVGERTPAWVGTYAAWQPDDAFSFYVDASVSRRARAYYPVADETPPFYRLEQSREARGGPQVLGVAGAKYVFEAGLDVRLEYLLNTEGHTRQERDAALLAASTPGALQAQNIERFLSPGLELPGRHYLYLSSTHPNAIPALEGSLALRYLVSLTDGSGRVSALGSVSLSPSDELFLTTGLNHGKLGSELATFTGASLLVGLTHSW